MKGIDLNLGIAVVTVIGQRGLAAGVVGKKKVYFPSGEAGDLSLPWVEEKAAYIARKAMFNGNFMVAELGNPAHQAESVTIMADPYLPPPELVILGGGHIALPLAKLGKLLGYRVAVVDDRPEFASASRFPEADRVICCSFDGIKEKLAFSPGSSVVVVTRGHRHDTDCLRQLVEHPLSYLGMIGSRRRIRLVRQQLIEEGFSAQRLDAVYMPVGLDIGAQTPEEIAVSIAAELIKARRGGRAASLSSRREEAGAKSCEMPSSMDLEILKKAVNSAGGDLPAALATVISTRGSTPRKAGARMLVYRDGRTFGTIGGGCGESEVRREALNVIDEGVPRLYRVALDADTAADEGMVCGGVMEVFIEPAVTMARILGGGDSSHAG